MIAVTGANGLLGSFIIRKLLETNQPFVALKRKGSDTSLLNDVDSNISWRDADVLDPVALEEALHDITHVIHTAAIVSFNPRDERKVFNVNVQGTKNIVDACLSSGVKRLLHISSVAALGRQKGQTLIDEDNKWVYSKLNSNYAESKYQAELEIFRAQEEGLSTVIINPSVILAPTDWNKSSAQLFKYAYTEKPFYINGSLNYVDVRDVAHVVCLMLKSENENERYIINAGSISFIDFFKKIAIRFNKKEPSIKLNIFTLKLAAFLEAIRAKITGKTPLITFETVRLSGTHFCYENKKIKQTLNFEFETIDRTLQWCCENYIRKINDKK